MVNPLSWDSEFFGINVGSVNLNKIEDLDKVNLEIFDLVYIVLNKKPDSLSLKDFSNQLFFADEKVLYSKNNLSFQKPLPSIVSAPSHYFPSIDRLISIAHQAGAYSRFKLDPLITASKFEEFYQIWIVNSINRVIADEVYIYLEDGIAVGLVSIGIKNGIPDIGLIGVDKAFRRKNIGGNLLVVAENWALNVTGINKIQVVTQGLNKKACSFYEKNGYHLTSKSYVYHWWKKK